MGKATAEGIRKLYQERFDKTAAHVAQMVCKLIDKELLERSVKGVNINACYAIEMENLCPEDYDLPEGMLEWRYYSTDAKESLDKLADQIVALIKQYYADWKVTSQSSLLNGNRFIKRRLVFDAKFEPEVKIYRPEDFDALFNSRVEDMIQYFVREIRKSIAAQYGKQPSSTLIYANSISYATKLVLDDENAKRVFCKVINTLKEDGWKVSVKSESVVETLYAKIIYSFVVSK